MTHHNPRTIHDPEYVTCTRCGRAALDSAVTETEDGWVCDRATCHHSITDDESMSRSVNVPSDIVQHLRFLTGKELHDWDISVTYERKFGAFAITAEKETHDGEH